MCPRDGISLAFRNLCRIPTGTAPKTAQKPPTATPHISSVKKSPRRNMGPLGPKPPIFIHFCRQYFIGVDQFVQFADRGFWRLLPSRLYWLGAQDLILVPGLYTILSGVCKFNYCNLFYNFCLFQGRHRSLIAHSNNKTSRTMNVDYFMERKQLIQCILCLVSLFNS